MHRAPGRVACWLAAALVAGHVAVAAAQETAAPGLVPGRRVLLDAHNAYPENGRWSDRLERALATGWPLAIEQDLVWARSPLTGQFRSVVSHGEPVNGDEPSLEEYFIARVKPVIERALEENRQETWPVIVLNLDFKTNEPAHHRAIRELLGRYEAYLVTALRTADPSSPAPLSVAPVLVLTGSADEQERSFHDDVAVGGRLRLFGAVHTARDGTPGPRTNYRRWVNYPWSAVEPEGQARAGDWTADDNTRLVRLAEAAHARGLWIRFYTLNGHAPDTGLGWTAGYNFGSLAAARMRWAAAIRAGVDFVAVDQYEEFAEALKGLAPGMPVLTPRLLDVDPAPTGGGDANRVVLRGTLTRADYERVLVSSFDVPPGTERIDLALRYDGGARTVIDLGLEGPTAFRGWSGGGPQSIFVATHSASYGYTPGPIEAGRWQVLLGVPNIRDGVSTPYELDVELSDGGGRRPILQPGAGWYAGDLHTHSGHSDGWARPGASSHRLKVPAAHVFAAASRAALDFVALTDHNTASHWLDVDRMQPLFPHLLLLHAREVTTYRGHVNAFGETRFVDFRLEGRSVADLGRSLAATAGFTSINHPTLPDDERCMGCGWNDGDPDVVRLFHGVEVVNGADPLSGWRWWANLLNQGLRLTAVGGSDDHSPDDDTDRQIGTPATVVFASELSERAITAGLRAGRVYVRTRGVAGPALEFSAHVPGTTVQMGGEAPAGDLRLEVATERAVGQSLDWIRNGDVVATTTVDVAGRAALTVAAQRGDWVSVVLRDATGPTALSNAIYVR